MGCVYLAKNIINNKCYVGMSIVSIKNRKLRHQHDAKHSLSSSPFHKDIREFGKENFEWIVLFSSKDEKALEEQERFFIIKYNCFFPNGYNLTFGGKGSKGIVFSKESLLKKKEIMRKIWERPGHKDNIKLKIKNSWKLRESFSGGKNPAAKKVKCIELNKVFDDARSASKETGALGPNICKAAKGLRKKAGGYSWMYV